MEYLEQGIYITVMEYEWNFGMYLQQTKSLDNIMTS